MSDCKYTPSAQLATGRTGRNVATTLITQGLRFGLQIFSLVVLSRLLSPEDFGVVAMAAVIVSLFSTFRDLGISQAIVQGDDFDEGRVSKLYWLSLLLGMLFCLALLLLSPLVAAIYSEPRLAAVTCAMSVIFLLSGPIVIHQGLLQRQMKFYEIGKAEVLAQVTSLALGIYLALQGVGYWALVWMQLLQMLVLHSLLWRATKWMPCRPNGFSGIREELRFGGYLTGFNFLNFFSRNADNFLIGKFVGPDMLGYYSRAYQLMLMPISQVNAPISAALIPTLSRLRSEPAAYSELYLRWVRRVAWFTMPPIAFMVSFGDLVVEWLLGPEWKVAGEIFRWLALAALFQPLANLTGVVFISLGDSPRMFLWGLVSSVVIVFSFLVGLNWGAFGVAIAYAVVINALFPILVYYAHPAKYFRISNYLRIVCLPVALSILTIAACLTIR